MSATKRSTLSRFSCSLWGKLSISILISLSGIAAKAATSSLHGKIVDSSDAAIPNAKLTAQCGPYLRETTSTADGSFEVEAAQSTCTVKVQAPGFTSYSQVVTLPVGADGRTILVKLQIADVTTSVTVQARQDAVQVVKLDADPMVVPLAIQSVPVTLAQDQGFTRILDVVRNVSGVTSKEAYFGVTDDFNIRGFDASTSLYNGFRRDFYGTVNDISEVERVEVIKGPSSVTEGFLEPGGVINVVTKRPLASPVSEVFLTTGTYGTFRGQYDLGTSLTSTLRIRSTGASEHTGSFRDFISGDRFTTGVSLDWNATPNTLVQASANVFYLNGSADRGLPILSDNPSLPFQLPISRNLGEPDDNYKQRNNNYSGMVQHGLGKSWSARAGANLFQLSDYRNNVEVDGTDPNNPPLLARELTIVYGESSFLNGVGEVAGDADTFHLHHHLVVGVDYQRIYSFYNFTENSTSLGIGTLDVPDIDAFHPVYGGFQRIQGPSTGLFHGYTYDTGSYAQDLISIGSRIHVLAGVRQDQFNYHDGDVVADYTTRLNQGAFSPRVGVVYQPAPVLSLYANYASSFNPQQGTVLFNGETPKPSRGRQEEVGVKYSSNDRRWTASADLFRITKTNNAEGDPNHPDYSILTGAEESAGAEADATVQLRHGVLLRANISDMRAVVTADNAIPVGSRLLNVPRLQGAMWAEAHVPHSRVDVNFGWFAVGQREAQLPNTIMIRKYNRFDAAVHWHLRPSIELSANVQNISNVVYYTSQNYELYPGTPTNAIFSLKINPSRHNR